MWCLFHALTSHDHRVCLHDWLAYTALLCRMVISQTVPWCLRAAYVTTKKRRIPTEAETSSNKDDSKERLPHCVLIRGSEAPSYISVSLFPLMMSSFHKKKLLSLEWAQWTKQRRWWILEGTSRVEEEFWSCERGRNIPSLRAWTYDFWVTWLQSWWHPAADERPPDFKDKDFLYRRDVALFLPECCRLTHGGNELKRHKAFLPVSEGFTSSSIFLDLLALSLPSIVNMSSGSSVILSRTSKVKVTPQNCCLLSKMRSFWFSQ